MTLPAGVQDRWPHRNRRYFYVASSNSAAGNVQTGTEHHVTAFRIDPATGALNQIGDPMRLPVRPIHMTLDNESHHILVAFNNPSSLRVYRIHKDFTPGEELTQGTMDAGIYAHQVRVTPDGRHVVLVTRGNEGTAQRPEDPGALMVFDYQNGMLSSQYKIAPNGGRGYGPRHLDFHPTKPWMERVDRNAEPDPHAPHAGWQAATGNRVQQDHAAGAHQRPRASGGERGARASEWAFCLRRKPLAGCGGFRWEEGLQGRREQHRRIRHQPDAGEPTAIQHIETQKIHPRTFHLDPGGRMLVAQHNLPVDVRDGGNVRTVSAGLSVFRMNEAGRLTFARTYDIDVGDKVMWWVGMVPL